MHAFAARAPTAAHRSPTLASDLSVSEKSRGSWLERAAVLVAILSWLFAVAFVLTTLRRLHGPSPVEVEQFWEASRLRRGVPLYVDPLVGGADDGLPLSRKLVLYTPVWPSILALLPEAAATMVFRLVVASTWLLGLPVLAHVAGRSPESRKVPILPVAVALSFAAFGLLSRSAWCAAADAPAALLAGYALVRTLQRDRVDAVSAAIFAVAPFLKPNVCMISITCFAVEVFRYRLRAIRGLWAAAIAGGLMLLFCHVRSHGAWVEHLRMSTVQPFVWAKWRDWIRDYFLFLGLPHLLLIGSALSSTRGMAGEARPRGRTYAFAAAISTWLWSAWLMGKAGAGTHYYIEPTVASVVLFARFGLPPVDDARARLSRVRLTVLVFTVIGFVVSLPLFRTWSDETRTFDANVPTIERACDVSSKEAMLSSNVRLEWALTHRIVIPEYQTSYLTRAGRLPLSVWSSTLLAPEVRCFVLEGDLPDRPPEPRPGEEQASVWYAEAADTLRGHFRVVTKIGNFTVYRKDR